MQKLSEYNLNVFNIVSKSNNYNQQEFLNEYFIKIKLISVPFFYNIISYLYHIYI